MKWLTENVAARKLVLEALRVLIALAGLLVADAQLAERPQDPTDGSAASMLRWAIAERIDKDRFFKEPGFLFGVSITRPKVYMSNLKGAGAAMLDNAFAWMPATLREEVYSSIRAFADGTGPIINGADATGYTLDLRDLFIHGDQFMNFSLAEEGRNLVGLPTTDLNFEFADSAAIDSLFAAAAPANRIRSDGIVTLNILGTQVDNT